MKVQKLNKTSLIMGGVIFFIAAMLTIAISSMVMSNANAEEEATASTNQSVVVDLTIRDAISQNPIKNATCNVTEEPWGRKWTGTLPQSDVNGKIYKENCDFTLASYQFVITCDGYQSASHPLSVYDDTELFQHTFELTPKAVTKAKVQADGGESAKFRYLSEGGVYDEKHEIEFEYSDLDALKIVPDVGEGVVYIKEGDDTKCVLKDNIDFKLTGDKVTQSADKTTFTVNVNTEPVLKANFEVAKGYEDKGSVGPENQHLLVPKGCTYKTKFGSAQLTYNSETIYVSVGTKENYLHDFWGNSAGEPVYANDITIEDNLNLFAYFKQNSSNEVTVISDKPFYYGDNSGQGDVEWSSSAESKVVIPVKDGILGIYLAPRYFIGAEELGDSNSGRLAASGTAQFQPAMYNYCFSYDKNENNLIPFEDMKVIEWTGPDNRTPKTIVIGNGGDTPQQEESANGSAQTGDITYIAIALLVCVGITSAVVAVRVRARRK
ncbi:MAG: hypothetical protein Q4E88_01075 [Coriobacteriia bacterium]|nr:hypothetical protein [Coriobacteriia bacterium]